MLHNLEIPRPIHALANAVHEAGGTAWLVGGCVRDHLMGLDVKDWDVEVHGLEVADLEAVLRGLGRVNAVGRSFGVLKLRPRGAPITDPEIDVSLPRRDSNAGPGHRGIAVVGDPWMSMDEAVRRRDLSINALMVEVRTKRLDDRVGGVNDLKAKRLRAVDPNTFLDDPLRALRVVQFAARTGFHADAELIGLCRKAPLHELPAERVRGEWEKLMLKGRHFATAFELAQEADLLTRVFPEVGDQPIEPLERAAALRGGLDDAHVWSLMMAVWLHGLEPAAVEATLDRVWLHKVGGFSVRNAVLALVAHAEDPLDSDSALRHLSVHVELDLAFRQRAALQAIEPLDIPRARAEALGITTSKPPLLLQGRDFVTLGIPKGRTLGVWVRKAYQAQLDGVFDDKEAALAWARAQLPT